MSRRNTNFVFIGENDKIEPPRKKSPRRRIRQKYEKLKFYKPRIIIPEINIDDFLNGKYDDEIRNEDKENEIRSPDIQNEIDGLKFYTPRIIIPEINIDDFLNGKSKNPYPIPQIYLPPRNPFPIPQINPRQIPKRRRHKKAQNDDDIWSLDENGDIIWKLDDETYFNSLYSLPDDYWFHTPPQSPNDDSQYI